uniref:Uncharacterized protein n=1 Tax=Callithrix jacchus TaxID=9483 RepID=A0A8I3W332_CALJA
HSLKQDQCIILHFLGEVRNLTGSAGFCALSLKAKIKVSSGLSSGGESTSRLIGVAGRIQLCGFVGKKSLFPCWLLARGCPQHLEATCPPWLMAHLILTASIRGKSPSCTVTLSRLFHFLWLVCPSLSSLRVHDSPSCSHVKKDKFASTSAMIL